MIGRLKIAWLVSLLFLSAVVSAQTTYYVDSVSGSDTNVGTSTSAPWKTLAHLAVVSTGKVAFFGKNDRILLMAGQTHTGPLTLQFQGDVDGTNNNLVIDRYGTGANPIISNASSSTATIGFLDSGGITVRNIETTGGAYGLFLGTQFTTGASGLIIEDCTFHDVSIDGIACLGPQVINGSPTFRISRCTVYNCQNDGISQNDNTSARWIIEDNVIHDIAEGGGAPGIDGSSGDGITGHNSSWGHTVTGNTIYTIRDGMHFVNTGFFDADKRWVVDGNYIRSTTQTGIRFENRDLASSTDGKKRLLRISNNVIAMSDIATNEAGIVVGAQVSSGAENSYALDLQVVNNTIYSTTAGVNTWWNLEIEPSNDENSVVTVMNNAIHSNNSAKAKMVRVGLVSGSANPALRFDGNRYDLDNALAFDFGGTTSNLAGFTPEAGSTSAIEALGLVGDPSSGIVANAALTASSAIIGDGINAYSFGITKDYARSVRPRVGPWDVGAYQSALRTLIVEGGRSVPTNKQVTLTANTVSLIPLAVPSQRLAISYSGLAANARLRIVAKEDRIPTTSWDAEEPGQVVLLSSAGNYGVPVEIKMDSPTWGLYLLSDQGVTVHMTAIP